MRRIFIVMIVLILIGSGMYYLVDNNYFTKWQEQEKQTEKVNLPKIKSESEKKGKLPLLEGDLFDWINKSSDELEESLGEPDRKDLTPYGYTWWVYTDEETNYIQFGVSDNQVSTVFATGQEVSSEPFDIGNSYDAVKEVFDFDKKVTYQNGMSFYNFLLSDDDIKVNPLIKIDDDLFVQVYFDTFTDQLSSIRILSGDILLKQRFYEMEFRGKLPEEENLTDDDWEKIEKGMEEEIFELTNVYRNRFETTPLVKDDQVKEVAFLHSKDMSDHNYFSHYRLDGSGLKERLEEKDIYYLSAGENIAAQHTDGPAAMEGWLNSESHREALLNEDYTHLGVGVYQLYYTQNFLLKP